MTSNNSGGPWGSKRPPSNSSGSSSGGTTGPQGGQDNNRPDDPQTGWQGGRPDRPHSQNGGQKSGSSAPEIDAIIRKGQEHLRVLMGGKSGGSGGSGHPTGGSAAPMGRGPVFIGLIAAFAAWLFMSFYRVDTSEQSVELFLGSYYKTGTEGLNFAPWPVVTKEILPVTRENTEEIGLGRNAGGDEGLMLTGDENIVDIDFQVVWNISDPAKFLFNLAAPRESIQAVSESAMREIIGRSDLGPILNTNRDLIANELQELIQFTLDSYDSGVNIVRVNLDKADPPREVIDSFRQVQAAAQTRDTLEKQADAYANKVVAEARGQAAEFLEKAEAYRARVVNDATGQASRFLAVYEIYAKAPEVMRRRLFLENQANILSNIDKVLIDPEISASGDLGGGDGAIPFLLLNELQRQNAAAGANGGQ